jgi:Arc/MetJ-type ribon-helix-helix transcriptional regulator
MTLTVRLPPRIEEALAAYCVSHRISRSDAVRQALERLLAEAAAKPSAYALGRSGFGADRTPQRDVARHTKRLLRERFRGAAPR